MRKFQWALARLTFYAYIVFSLGTGVGGYLTAPLMTYCIFGDWRFWKHISPGWKLFFHGWKISGLIFRGQNGGFLLAVPLTEPPFSAPRKSVVRPSESWEHGDSCGTCKRCCSLIKCPVLDKERGLCLGYDSFFWRYFNCGRFPSKQSEIDYYGCPKWLMQPRPAGVEGYQPAQPYPVPTGGEALGTE